MIQLTAIDPSLLQRSQNLKLNRYSLFALNVYFKNDTLRLRNCNLNQPIDL